jgi:hypothetical protein
LEVIRRLAASDRNGPPGEATPGGPIERGLGRPIKRSHV